MGSPQRYRRNPQPVEAQKYVAGDGPGLALWSGGKHETQEKASDPTDVSEHVLIPHISGPLIARVGMYVVKGEDGRFMACDSETFERDYQPAVATR